MRNFKHLRVSLALALAAGSLAITLPTSAALPRLVVCSAAGKAKYTFSDESSANVGRWLLSVTGTGTCTGALINPLRVRITSLRGDGCLILDFIMNDPCADWRVVVQVTLTDPATGAQKKPLQIWIGVADARPNGIFVSAAPFVVKRPGFPATSQGAAGVLLRPNGASAACSTSDTSCYPASFVWSFPTQP